MGHVILDVKPIDFIFMIVAAIVLVGIIIGVFIFVKKKEGHVKVDEDFINKILSFLGGKENIDSIEVEQARLKIKVNDLTITDLEGLKSISEKGVFVSGNNIKTLFKYESKKIASEIKKVI